MLLLQFEKEVGNLCIWPIGVPIAVDVVLIVQDVKDLGAVENLLSLYPLKEQLHATLKHVEGLLACAAQEGEINM